ncbi:MAG: hypothetical protein KC731_10355 [Myxococcales bacterium]|nr:hypothetical protein [Myxococcales bacterium]
MLLALCLGLALVATTAGEARAEESPKPLDADNESVWDHFELSMGFLAGGRRYDKTNFAYQDGDGGVAKGLREPFRADPFHHVPVFGLRYDVRLVASYVRMTAGFDLPFASFDSLASTGNYVLDGESHQVSVQGIYPKELRFGIGGEYPFGPVAPFIDVLGGVHWVTADLTVDGKPASYDATSFSFSARAGLRLHVRDWFFASIAGEAGIVGETVWGAELAVGFALM